jgi:hypothetical protein
MQLTRTLVTPAEIRALRDMDAAFIRALAQEYRDQREREDKSKWQT